MSSLRRNVVDSSFTRALIFLAPMVFPAALQSQKDAGETAWAYDIVSIKLEDPNAGSVGIRRLPTGFEASMVTVKELITDAYGLQDSSLVLNAPDGKAKYHVVAKLDSDKLAQFTALRPEEQAERRRQMLQAMLVEYFHLKVHHDTKSLAVYSLVVDKQGLKAKPAAPVGVAEDADRGARQYFGDGRLVGQYSITQLAHVLYVGRVMQAEQSDRPIMDETGIQGQFQFDLAWETSSKSEKQESDRTTVVYGSLESALINEAGLRLVPKKIQADAIVVDHVEDPTLN